jgi:hypothetical protein
MWPSKSTPGGCLLAFFGASAFLYAGLALTAAWLVWKRDSDSDRLGFLLTSGCSAAALGILFIIFGFRLALRVPRDYDPFDPEEPRLKF